MNLFNYLIKISGFLEFKTKFKIAVLENSVVSSKLDPDFPANCWINKTLSVNGFENITAAVEWTKPAIRKGVVIRYKIKVECVGLDSPEFVTPLVSRVVNVHNDLEERYSCTMSGLPSFSFCKFSIAV